MDLGDLMKMMSHLVLQDHQERKKSEKLEDHQENRNAQENITIIIVLVMVPRENKDNQVDLAFQEHLDPHNLWT